MNLLAVIMIFIGLNIDTFIALLFVLRNYNYRLPIITFVTATITLWILGVVLGKGLAALFPDWITGFMGIVLIFLAVFGQSFIKHNCWYCSWNCVRNDFSIYCGWIRSNNHR